MATLAEIRAKLQAQDNKSDKKGFGDKQLYPHWNINENESCLLRFLPDKNTKNSFFWVERALINLSFPSVKGASEAKTAYVKVPCMEMWGETCPVLTEVRPWYKDASLKEQAGKYWKKRTYLMQGFVRENPIEEETPENLVRRFIISPQLFSLIKAALLDPELEELPTDFNHGLDFRINKTAGKGGYSDYNTSKWSRKESALTDKERAAIEQYGLFDLSDGLPKKPSDKEVKIIKEMFEASVNGDMYDPEKWGEYFKPGGSYVAETVDTSSAKATTHTTHTTQAAPVQEDSVAPVVTPTTAPKSTQATDILKMIKERQANAKK